MHCGGAYCAMDAADPEASSCSTYCAGVQISMDHGSLWQLKAMHLQAQAAMQAAAQ